MNPEVADQRKQQASEMVNCAFMSIVLIDAVETSDRASVNGSKNFVNLATEALAGIFAHAWVCLTARPCES